MPKRWEQYKGKSWITCNGRCVCARNLSVFYLTLLLVVVFSGLFFAFDCRFLAVNLSPAVPVFAVLQCGFVLACLLRTTLSDPGIIPRAGPDEAAWMEAEMASHSTVPQYETLRDIRINGRLFKLKFCQTCKLWRPPRASHCSTCDNCVDRFDHHCPWVGNCVGRRNYRYFYLFLASVTVYCVYIMVFGCINLVILILVAFFSLFSVVGLGGFHTLLICRETSTNEDIKDLYNTKRNPDLINPFDHGGGCANFCYILFGPTAPSLAKFDSELEPEWRPPPPPLRTENPRRQSQPQRPVSQQQQQQQQQPSSLHNQQTRYPSPVGLPPVQFVSGSDGGRVNGIGGVGRGGGNDDLAMATVSSSASSLSANRNRMPSGYGGRSSVTSPTTSASYIV